jgi:hypothetical protein
MVRPLVLLDGLDLHQLVVYTCTAANIGERRPQDEDERAYSRRLRKRHRLPAMSPLLRTQQPCMGWVLDRGFAERTAIVSFSCIASSAS